MITQQTDHAIDAVGVGIGPFNLSVAALLQPIKELTARFFDREQEFQWHPGLLFPEAAIQVSFLKDLVTLADPTSPYSFLSYLFSNKRLYRFITANYSKVMRLEFNEYFRWVCNSLPNLEFGCPVQDIALDGDLLAVNLGHKLVRTKSVILGTGLSPNIPECARPHIGRSVFHACKYLKQDVNIAGKRVAVIGGGQTGAEIVFHLLSDAGKLPQEVYWVSRRSNFLPLDESPFTNEFFTPPYSDYFFNLRQEDKARLLAEQKFASDGISIDLLERLYRCLYDLEFLQKRGRLCCLYPGSELMRVNPGPNSWLLEICNVINGQTDFVYADVVVLCTGFDYRLPGYLESLSGRIALSREGFLVRNDFSIEWDGPASLKIYVQNAARHSRGIADPNLSLMAWRSAVIINSLAGRCVYDVNGVSSAFDWTGLKVAKKHGGSF